MQSHCIVPSASFADGETWGRDLPVTLWGPELANLARESTRTEVAGAEARDWSPPWGGASRRGEGPFRVT